jgi:hypothetical protein
MDHGARLGGQRGELTLGGWALVFVAVSICVWVPYAFLTHGKPAAKDPNLVAIDKATDTSAEVTLTDAAEVAQTWYATNGSLAGFTPLAATAQEPSTMWDASLKAEKGRISIRGATDSSVVLVTKGSGPLCVAVNANGTLTYGHVDAQSASQCTGAAW